MHKKLIYNGKSSADMGLVIQAPPAYSVPERDVEKTHVPGRNGDVISDNGCYKNTTRTYSLAKGYVYGPVKTTVANGQELYEWLTSAKGKYVHLEDDYDPDVYRLATYISSGTLTDIFDKALTFNVEFECKPQRFLKHGLIPVLYGEGATSVTIHNLSHYEAKPEIKIENIPSGMNAITLMSVEDENGEEVSLVTLKGDPSKETTLILDSEEEECYDEEGNDSYDKVSLNGKNFPILKNGDTHIQITQYDREDFEIPSYNTVIQSKQQICESKFLPKDDLIASYEETYIIRPFNTLVKERENSFETTSYHTRLTELCDEGKNIDDRDYALSTTIESPNNYMNGTTIECDTVSKTDFESTFNNYGLGSYLELVTSGSSYAIRVKSGETCYVKRSDNKIVKYTSEEIIINMADFTDKQDIEVIYDILKSIDGDLPTFVSCTIVTNNNTKEVTSINYAFDFHKPGHGYPDGGTTIYWKDKIGLTGLFGKAGWSKCANGDKIVNYTWSGLKHKFVMNGNTFASDNGYSLRFVCFDDVSADSLQYDFGPNSSKIFKVKLYSDGNRIEIRGNYTGYYKVSTSNSEWVDRLTEEDLEQILGQVDCNKSFSVEYLKTIPKYSNESDWPSWLDSSVEFYKNTSADPVTDVGILNSDHIKIKSNLGTYFRDYKTINDVEEHNNFYKLLEHEYIKSYESSTSDLQLKLNENFKIGKYWGPNEDWRNPYNITSFKYDRGNSTGNATPKQDLPEWLRYEVEMKVKFNSDPDHEYRATQSGQLEGTIKWTASNGAVFTTKDTWYAEINAKIFDELGNDEIGYVTEPPIVFFYSGLLKGGFYKYDNSSAWVYYKENTSDVPIVKIGYKDTVNFYYIESLPKDEDYLDYFKTTVNIWKTEDDEHPAIYTKKGIPDAFDYIYSNSNLDESSKIGQILEYHDDQGAPTIVYIIFEGTELLIASQMIPEWLNYFTMSRKPAGDLNPLSIDFIVNNNDGYYKANSQVHWTKYKVGDTVLTTLVSETNKISHLKEKERNEDGKQPSLSKVKIAVTPKWWML